MPLQALISVSPTDTAKQDSSSKSCANSEDSHNDSSLRKTDAAKRRVVDFPCENWHLEARPLQRAACLRCNDELFGLGKIRIIFERDWTDSVV